MQGVLLVRYYPKGVNVNSEICVSFVYVLKELKNVIWWKQPELRLEDVFFILDNAKPHTAMIIEALLHKFGYMFLDIHPTTRTWYPIIFFFFLSWKSTG